MHLWEIVTKIAEVCIIYDSVSLFYAYSFTFLFDDAFMLFYVLVSIKTHFLHV